MNMANTKRAAAAPKPMPSKTAANGRGWRLLTATTPAGHHMQDHASLKQNRCEKGADMASGSRDSPILTWQGAELPRVLPGDYQAVCVGWQGPEWCLTFRRWSLRLELSLLGEGIAVSAFFNFGSDPEKPHIGRQSRFFAVWCMANGEAPRKGQEMALSTFTEPGLLYFVRVADCLKDRKDAHKPDALVYSRVTEILKIERP
jgi:hypothetical protein